jgi:hypothetical protein
MADTKRQFSVIVFVSIVALLAGLAIGAQSYNTNNPHHALQQVTTDETGSNSVDANSNGIIDQAESIAGGCVQIFNGATSPPAGNSPAGNPIYHLSLPAFCYQGNCKFFFSVGAPNTGNHYTDIIDYVQRGALWAANVWPSTTNIGFVTAGGTTTQVTPYKTVTSITTRAAHADLRQVTIANIVDPASGAVHVLVDDNIFITEPATSTMISIVASNLAAINPSITIDACP